MKLYAPYEYIGENLMIGRYLVLDEQPGRIQEYDLFDRKLPVAVQEKLENPAQLSACPVLDELDRGRNNTLKRYKNKKVCLYVPIYSKWDTTVILYLNICMGKIWVNGKCLIIHSEAGMSTSLLTALLCKGVNHVILELLAGDSAPPFSLRIHNHTFEMSDDKKALSHVLGAQLDPLTLVHEPFYCPAGDTYRFMYMKNDDQLLENYQANVFDDELGFIKSIPARLNEVVIIDIQALRKLHGETMCHEWIGCDFQNRQGEKVVGSFIIALRDFRERAGEICRELAVLSREQDPEVDTYCKGWLMKGEELEGETTISHYNVHLHCKMALLWLHDRTFPREAYKTPGNWEWFLHSEIDDSTVRIGIRMPPGYDEQKGYPVFLALATGNDGGFCGIVEPGSLSEDCLCFDVSGRGVTGGSYVGEASILEILSWIRCHFHIDEERIYIIGASNGGYAAYALAQNYPSLPAAVFPCVGHPQLDSIRNISNIPTYQLVSSNDWSFAGRENDVKRRIGQYGNYHQYDYQTLTHHDLMMYLGHKGILNDMLRHRRNPYPQQILFQTTRNRHAESFWIRLHGIAHGHMAASIRAKIVNAAHIQISARHVRAFTLTIPPQIDIRSFSVVINGQTFMMENFHGSAITFLHEKRWVLVDQPPAVDWRKGTGLADVYLGSLRLILPEQAGKALTAVADRYAHPCSGGYEPKIHVSYPVYSAGSVPDHIFSHHLILFDRAFENPYVRRFRRDLPVQYDEEGFVYQGKRYEGEYIIRQVIPNPFDNRRSILVYSFNRESLLDQDIFSRKAFLPYYASGCHPYWNNEILIYYQGKYWAAYEEDAPLKIV